MIVSLDIPAVKLLHPVVHTHTAEISACFTLFEYDFTGLLVGHRHHLNGMLCHQLWLYEYVRHGWLEVWSSKVKMLSKHAGV